MNIKQATNAVRAGEFVLSNHPRNKIGIVWDLDLKNKYDINKQHTMAYCFVINDIIYKIGQTDSRSGIKGAMDFYIGAMTGEPGPSRFVCHLLIAEQLLLGNKAEVYVVMLSEPIKINLPGLYGFEDVETLTASKYIEALCINEFKLQNNHTLPIWNTQEQGASYPELEKKLHADFKAKIIRTEDIDIKKLYL